MNLRSSSTVSVIAALLVVLAGAPAAAQSRIAILDGTGVSVLDTTTGQLRARFELSLPSLERPYGINASADGNRLLVTTSEITASEYEGTRGALYVLDAVTGERLARVPTPPSHRKPMVAPDGSRAFLFSEDTVFPHPYPHRSSIITAVNLSTLAVQPYSSSALASCWIGDFLAMHPDGGMLYLRCIYFGLASGQPANLIFARVTPTGVEADPGFPRQTPATCNAPSFPFQGAGVGESDPKGLSASPDGTRLFVASTLRNDPSRGYQFTPRLEVCDTATRALLHSYVLSDSWPADVEGGFGRVRAQSASRVFIRLTAGSSLQKIALFDTDAGAVLGEALRGGVLIGDQSGALTFALEANRLSRLDNDTAAATTIATGPGGWLDAAVLTDTCPFTVTASSRFFTTTGGTGTLTIDAAPSCAWTVDANELPGVSFSGAPSGQGSATLDFSLAPAAAPKRGVLHVGSHPLAIEQTMPVTHIDAPAGGALGQPFTVRGWAIDVGATPPIASPTVSMVHVWAWPVDGGAPHFVGATGAAIARPDVGAVYGSGYDASGFELTVRGLPSGLYTIVAYAQGARGGTFAGQAGVVVMVQAATLVAIDMPIGTVPRHFVVSGWAIDPSAGTGPGVDAVHVWAYPAGGGAPIWVGAAAYGGARADVAARFGASFANSSYWLFASLPPGDYTLAVFGRSTVTGEFTATTAPLTVVPDSAPEMGLDEPAAGGGPLSGTFRVQGWGLDRGAASGTGMDAFHVWAFPIDGRPPVWVGAASPVSRPDVAAIFGPQFTQSGFVLNGATLPGGTYDLAVFGHSTVTQSFSTWRTVRITVVP